MNRSRAFALALGLGVALAAHAATFPYFGPATGVLKGNAASPTTTAATYPDIVLMWTGCGTPSTKVLMADGTCQVPAAVTPAALTKTDDTNVTLTLGGTPATALLQASSLTLGWTGTLSAARGGFGMSTVTDDTVAVANGTTWQSKALTDCDTATSAVTYDTTTNAWGCNSITGATFANPSASIGLTANNGAASTAMRSDATPALSQAIAPTWTATHTFTPASGRAITANGTANQYTAVLSAAATTGQSFGLGVRAGTNSSDTAMDVLSQDGTRNFLSILGNGGTSFGNTTNNPAYSFLGTGAATFGGPLYAPDGTVAAPSHTFTSDPDTGIYRVGANLFSLVAAGSTTMQINAGHALGDDGTAANAMWSFFNDTDTGIYRVAANTVGIATNGVRTVSIAPSGLQVDSGQLFAQDGSAGSPGYSFAGDTNTGIFRAGADDLGFVLGGATRVEMLTGSAPLQVYATDTGGDGYIQFRDSAASTKGYMGYAGAASDEFDIFNGENAAVRLYANATLGLTVHTTGGITTGTPTGGDKGAGTVNATGLYINGVSVSGGVTQTGTFTATVTGVTSGSCTMKYRLTGSQVSMFVDAGGTCTGSSNAGTFTITGMPSLIRPSNNASVVTNCTDNSVDKLCLANFLSASATITFYLPSLVTGELSSTSWTTSGTKGLSTGVMIYDLRN